MILAAALLALSALFDIRQQLAGACEELTGHLVLQHCMLSIAAAVPKPHAGPSWTSSTDSSSVVSARRTILILNWFRVSGKRNGHSAYAILRETPYGLLQSFCSARIVELAVRLHSVKHFCRACCLNQECYSPIIVALASWVECEEGPPLLAPRVKDHRLR